jgi:hypothetical protein
MIELDSDPFTSTVPRDAGEPEGERLIFGLGTVGLQF